MPQPMNITLAPDLAQLVREKVASGAYASEQDVIRESLAALTAGEAATDAWLHDEVLPTLDAHDANPSRAVPIDEAERVLHARVDAKAGARRGGA